MNIVVAIILGLVQGLAEFLPISSSGHLFILQQAFGIQEGGIFFSVMLHIGTLFAVCIVYRRTLLDLLKHPFQKKTYLLIASTIVTVAIYLLFKSFFDEAMETGALVGISFIFTAVILLISDFISVHASKNKDEYAIKDMKYPAAIGIGFMQGIGVLPGVSRSGSTIAGAKIFGLLREDAAEFSFLLSIPAIIGGFVTEIPYLFETGVSNIPWAEVIIGMIAAFVSGYFAVRFMIKLISTKKLWGFSIYTGILGLLILLDMNLFHLIFK
ncbi:MAG TPA: undecaprenyl-diphosphate phosphatase [Clostridiales bacterium]|nr:undecaprenyl-diphosphate phosphatase [Clostridiales bacterium]